MKTILHKANTRGHANHGWLDAHHSFSFGQWQNPERVHFGALRVLNDDIVKGGYGFGTHPHDNMEIVTIPLRGALEHKDNSGGQGVINRNDVQLMSAGTGVTHSEFNHNKDLDTNLLQIWVFPREKNVTPRYDQKTFDPKDRANKLQTIIEPDQNTKALWLHQDTWFSLGNFSKDNGGTYQLHGANNGVYAFVIKGDVTINDVALNERDALGITEIDTVSFTANNDAEILLIEVPMEF